MQKTKAFTVFLIVFLVLSILTVFVSKVKANPDSDTWQVGESADDFSIYGAQVFSNTDGYMRIGHSGSSDLYCGARFTGITIPKVATINSAYLKLTARLAGSDTIVNTNIEGEAVDNADQIADYADWYDIYLNHRTSASVAWNNIPAWSVNEYGDDTFSPDIKTIIQEIVNRDGWSSGNAINIFVDDTTSTIGSARYAWSYDSSSAKAPNLEITWTTEEEEISYTFSQTIHVTDSGVTWKSKMTSFSQTIIGSSLIETWKAKQISVSETITLTALGSFLKAKGMINSESITLEDLTSILKAKGFTVSDMITVQDLMNILRELGIDYIEFFDVVEPSSESIMVREFVFAYQIEHALAIGILALVIAIIGLSIAAIKKD